MRVGKQESPAYLATLQVVPGILSHLNDCGAGLGRLAAGSTPYMREKRVFSTIAPIVLGLIPRVWGKRLQGGIPAKAHGLNPTCAGKTTWFSENIAAPGAQPHVCGENPTRLRTRRVMSGSTPRVWGKHFLTRLYTCKMSETHSLSHSGVSRRCPPTETFTPCSGCSGLGNPPEGFKPVYEALPLPEASAPPTVWWVVPKILGRVIRIPHLPVAPHQL